MSETRDPGELQTVIWASCVYGSDGVSLDDPAESYHEASRLHRAQTDPLDGLLLLEQSRQLRITTTRAVKRSAHVRSTPLPEHLLGDASLGAAIQGRASGRVFSPVPLDVEQLATVLHAGYGVTHRHEATSQPLRSVPSGGALYPLELYPTTLRVRGVESRVYHYDPLRRCLEHTGPGVDEARVAGLTPFPDLFGRAGAVVFVSAMIWRTRFKYGQRGYRFALLEAGHVCQNMLLAAAALDLAAVAVGGFYDREVEELIGANGLDEIALYAVSIGSRGEATQ